MAMTLKKKILIGQGFAIFLTTLVVSWAVVHLVFLGKASDAILKENYRSILAAENMLSALERQDSGMLLILNGEVENGASQFRSNEAVFHEWLTRAKDNVTIIGESDLIQSIEMDYAGYRNVFSKLINGINGQGADRSVFQSAYRETAFPLFSKIRKSCIDLRTINERTMYAASANASQEAHWAIGSTVAVAGAALIVAIVFSLLSVERIVKPIRHFMEASRKISQGDYRVQVPVETHDELGLLAVELNLMASQLDRYHALNIEQIISEKKKSDTILAAIEDGLVVFDMDLAVEAINPAAYRILGVGVSEYGPLTCSDIIPEPALCDIIGKIAETEAQPFLPDEKRVVTFSGNGSTHHYLFSTALVRGKERGLSRIVLLLKDITRLKEVERLKSEFVTAASHELRTPLTTLSMGIDLLLERASMFPEKDRELLQACHEEVHRMKALVNDLLDLSRIEAGRIDLEFEQVSVRPLFENVRTIFKNRLEQKRIDLTVKVPENVPEIRADANKATWVLTNLVSNALRYVKDEGYIALYAERVGSNVHLSVTDDGPGIPEEYHTKIFQKFVQVEGQPFGGSGLGLAICKEIVRAHGGTIWVESLPGQGSTFTFTMPVAL
jgi:two-component system, NtrC family, sensor histidine kinase KinB